MRQREKAWPPRVLHVIDSLALGGAERMAVELANAAHRRGWGVAVLATRRCGATQAKLDAGIPCVSLDRRFRFDPRALPKLGRVERDFRPGLLHIHGLSSAFFVAGVKVLGILRQPSLLHDHYGEIHTADRPAPLARVAIAWSLKRIVGVSRRNADWARRSGFSDARIRVIPNALDVGRIRATAATHLEARFGGAVQRPCGIVVGRMHPQKGIATLIHAADRLPTNVPWSLIVVGGGLETDYGRACLEEVRRRGLAARLHFVGAVEEPVALMKACDFAVIPSDSESGPLVLIEYLACELPVVATDVGENTRMAKEAEAIRCVPPQDAAALAQAIQSLLSMSREQRACAGSLGWERTRDLFDMERVFPRWEALYREVCGF